MWITFPSCCVFVCATRFADSVETVSFDYCIISAGCNFGPFHQWGESLWFPTIHEEARPNGSWPHIDERFIEGRRRHILEEYDRLAELNKKKASILVVGAGFIGVEWVTELQHYFPNLKVLGNLFFKKLFINILQIIVIVRF